MSAEYQAKLKAFNQNGSVWAIPRNDTLEKKMLQRGIPFRYNLVSKISPNLHKDIVNNANARIEKEKQAIRRAYARDAERREDERISKMLSERPKGKHNPSRAIAFG
jgi:hypothetical protein